MAAVTAATAGVQAVSRTLELEESRLSELLENAIKSTEARRPEVEKFELHQRQARLFSLSGLFSDIKGQSQEQALAQAFVKIDLGESMGLSPAEAMTGIDLIQGRVAISANIRASRMQRAGYTWDILQLDNKGCRLRLRYKGELIMREEVDEKTGAVRVVPAVISFTEADAQTAGLLHKDNYKKNPRNMYFARAITNAQRWYAPGILSLNILSTEEAVDIPGTSDPIGQSSDRFSSRVEEINSSEPTPSKITQDTARQFASAWKSSGFTIADAKAKLEEIANVTSSLDVTVDKIEPLMRWATKNPNWPNAAESPDEKLAHELFSVLQYDLGKQADAIGRFTKDGVTDWASLNVELNKELPAEG